GDKLIPWKVISEHKGSELAGSRYEQLLPYATPTEGDAFKVVTADFVSTEDGTGIVHIAPSFGADDFKTARENGIGSLTLVDKKGRFTDEVVDFAGEFVKEQYLTEEEKEAEKTKQGREKYLSVDERISIKLKQENKAFKVERYEHTYPHCWRTDKPILYYPLESWFIKTTAAKDRLVELNKTINWKPKSTGEGRFGNWLENLVDWNLSRSRYWGTPLPIWRTEDGTEEKCIGSIAELIDEVNLANSKLGLAQKINAEDLDLHRPFVDNYTLVSASGKAMSRETDLIDVWFDSGAMPYAQWHFPFENEEVFKRNFPADYIAEGVDQTRGWFFTLHALSVLLFDSIAYKNVIANGLVLDKFGNKMSKRLGNAVDPFETIDKYGADAVRWYMVTNAPPWDNLKFDMDGVVEVQRKFFGTLYNTYSFFALYANVDQFSFNPNNTVPIADRTELDRWILSKLNSLKLLVQESMEDYDPTSAGRAIEEFVGEHLSNWYVRLSRRRFWKSEMNADKKAAYETIFECLETVSKLMCSISPFFSDWLYQSLNADKIATGAMPESVHLSEFPISNSTFIDRDLEETMEIAENLCSLVLSLRKKEKLKVRQPLQKMMVPVLSEKFGRQLNHVSDLIKHEVNIKEIEQIDAGNTLIVKKLKPNFKTLGPKLGADMKAMANAANNFTQDDIRAIESQGYLDVNLGTRQFQLELMDVEILTQDMPGWLVATDKGITVALDITLTDVLLAEGLAREFVNRVQTLRKESGLEITDRIHVNFTSDAQVKDSILLHMDYICNEILADSVIYTDSTTGVETDVYEKPVWIQLTKA
ncbi:MAG: isoleucine--tRNA ligase, partial [Bacteroidia bacterium]|nr:isoleucine--tRNA ligase [Bacteroidia bacterium]